LFPLALALCLPFAASYVTDHAKEGVMVRTITYVSKISNSVYLIHHFLFHTVGFGDYHFDNYVYAILYYGLYLAVLAGSSSLLFYVIEQPMLRYRDKRFPAR
jgi:peptidoglycan/LPS O-acetylase OafA/YrhL